MTWDSEAVDALGWASTVASIDKWTGQRSMACQSSKFNGCSVGQQQHQQRYALRSWLQCWCRAAMEANFDESCEAAMEANFDESCEEHALNRQRVPGRSA